VTSLYDLLGTAPDATEEQLRQAYRRAARRVPPAVNSSPDSDAAIRQLNQAWVVLGDPERRRRYDAEIGVGAGPARGAPSARPSPPVWDPGPVETLGRRSRLWRPSVVVVGILATIFVVTAYAGSHDHQGRSTLPSTPATETTQPAAVASPGSAEQPEPSVGGDGAAGANLVGKCILRLLGYDAIVVCNQPGAQMIEAEVATDSDCPAGTTVYQLEGRSQLVCLASKA
jgi:hypothetical protein